MQFLKTIFTASALASIALAAQNSVTFVSQDSTDRQIIFTPSAGLSEIETLEVAGYETKMATFPEGWTGNFFSINKGDTIKPGMLGEFSFNAYAGSTFFDVSAIIDPTDTNGVKEIFPKNSNTPMSGCQDFPCDNAYNKWNDIQTMSSTETEFVCLIGTLETTRRRGVVARDFAAEKMIHVTPLTGEVPTKQ